MLAEVVLNSSEKMIVVIAVAVIILTVLVKNKSKSPDLTEEELIDIQVYGKLTEEGKLLHKLVELQKTSNQRVNGILWYLLGGSIFVVISFLIGSM